LLVASLIAAAGCGSSGSSNVVKVAVSPAAFTVIVTQTLTLTSIVTGTTNTNVTWSCTYATTFFDSNSKAQTGTSTACNNQSGNIPTNSTNTTVVFTAPQSLPDLTKLQGTNCTATTTTCTLVITITATSAADTKATGTALLSLDSGISVVLVPTTATVPTSSNSSTPSQFQFNATLTNDIGTIKGVTWLLTQGTPSGTTNFPDLTSCSPTCGSIDGNGLYSAPTAVPTTATVTLVVTSKADPLRFALGTITIITGGPITFKGISPTIVPQGVAFFDIYLEAPGVTSASQVTLTADNGGSQPILFSSGQLKVLFPLPTSTTTAPASTGVRLRLLPQNLGSVDSFTVSVSDPSQTVTTAGPGPYRYSVVPVRATTVASVPDSIVQNAQSNELDMIVNGGYFGPNGSFVGGGISFQGTPILADPNNSTSRQLLLAFPSNLANSSQPGLYPFSVVRTAAPAPADDNASVTNLAIFPDYQTGVPTVSGPFTQNLPVAGGGATLSKPGAIAIDPDLGIAAVADTGNNQAVFFKVNAGGTLTPYGTTTTVGTPTSVSVNRTLHTAVVVGNSDQNVYVFPIPQTPNSTSLIAPTTTISMSSLLPSEISPLPTPYSVGVDSDTNRAIVAYSSTANPTTAKVGFLLDLNTGDTGTSAAPACLKIPGQNVTTSPCVSAQVTLNTGMAPQIAMLPHSHLAVVTPGGLGITSGIDVTKSSASVGIASVSLTSGLVTVTTSGNHGLNPGNPGTVLILGVPKGTTNQTDFNGAFTVLSVINSTSFTYALTATVNDTATGNTDSAVYFGTPNISIGGLSQTVQGVAVNPVTGVVATADPNSTGQNGPQINFLSSLDQNVSSIIFHAGCVVSTTNCSNSPELPGTATLDFQPYVNSLISYNAQLNQISISNPVTLGRYSVQTLPSGTGQASVGAINLSGGLAVDGATNQALVVQSGSSSILVVNLGPVPSTVQKAVHISEVLVPSADGVNIGGIPGATFPQGTLSSANTLTGVKIFGAGFSNSPVVRLDGTALAAPTVISDRQLQVDIPASFLKHPHRYALDVIAGGVQSNAADFIVVAAVDLSQICKDTSGNSLTHPSAVAIADQLALQGYAPKAVVTNTGCNSISVIDIAPQLPTYDTTNPQKPVLTGFADNANFGKFKVITVGSAPTGVSISSRLGIAVVSNNSAGTASIIDLVAGQAAAADVTTGTGPAGVAVNDATLAALVANTGSNTLSQLNLASLSTTTATPVTTIAVDTEPIAIAIDQDRGTNNLGLAVVTALRLNSAALPSGVLDSIDIGLATPAKSTTAAIGSVTATPTGIVFDPSVSPALFYAVSSGGNVVSSFNPDNGFASTVHVGINPTSLAINPQTGAILTLNSLSNTVSVVDTLTSPFKTRRSYGLPGSPTLGVAIDQFLNLAVVVDQANNRVFIFPMPN
jgi:DNA-binding beta-propeller fold protein YncE